MVFAGMAFSDGGFHEAGEGGEDVDGWVDAFVIELAVDEDLAFGYVACEVGNGMGDVCPLHQQFIMDKEKDCATVVWHGENGDLGD